MALVSAYRDSQNKPGPVMQWEQAAVGVAPENAQTQLLYTIAVQAYKIRMLLIYALFVIPAALVVVTIILLSSL